MVFDQTYDPYSPYQFPWMGLNFFFALWFASICLYNLLAKVGGTKEKFKSLPEDKKRNVVAYIFQCNIASAALALQTYGGRDILFQGRDSTTPKRIEACRLAMSLVLTLYVWELCYRTNICFHLMLHHVLTVVLIQLGYVSFFDTKDVLYLRFGLILLYYATTEQLSFVALCAYRLDKFCKYQPFMFFLAAAQTILFKTAITLAAVVLYAATIRQGSFQGDRVWGKFWMVAFMFLVGALTVAQAYASRILFLMGVKCKSRSKQEALATSEDLSVCAIQHEERPTSELEDVEASRTFESCSKLDGTNESEAKAHENKGFFTLAKDPTFEGSESESKLDGDENFVTVAKNPMFDGSESGTETDGAENFVTFAKEAPFEGSEF